MIIPITPNIIAMFQAHFFKVQSPQPTIMFATPIASVMIPMITIKPPNAPTTPESATVPKDPSIAKAPVIHSRIARIVIPVGLVPGGVGAFVGGA